MPENSQRLFDNLDSSNYLTWASHVRDYLYDNDLRLVWDEAADDDGELGNLPVIADAAEQEVFNKKLRRAWSLIRRHLDSEIFNSTDDPDNVTYGNVIELLIYLRKQWRDFSSAFDRNLLREQYLGIRFS